MSATSFRPDGRVLAVSSRPETVELVDTATGKVRGRIRSGRDSTGRPVGGFRITWSPDGRVLRTDGNTLDLDTNVDQTTQLWDLDTGFNLQTGRNVRCISSVWRPEAGVFLSSDETAI